MAGGTGSAKLLRGLSKILEDFVVISNVGDNFWVHGLYVCPDIDIAVYTLSGMSDERNGWGVAGDTHNVLAQLGALGQETWFKLGDKDLATSILRTQLLTEGKKLGEITRNIASRLGVRQQIIPATEERLETYIRTETREMHLQEFWVRERGEPDVREVMYRGADTARASHQALAAIRDAEKIIFCPANPVTSIMPILSVEGMREAISKSNARKVAISPIIGGKPVSGPAAKFMRALDLEPTASSVARLYMGLIDCFIADVSDESEASTIAADGTVEVRRAEILMENLEKEVILAKVAVGA